MSKADAPEGILGVCSAVQELEIKHQGQPEKGNLSH